MPRGGQKSYIQQDYDDHKKQNGGDMNRPAKGNQNPYQWKPKKAKLPSERKGYNV